MNIPSREEAEYQSWVAMGKYALALVVAREYERALDMTQKMVELSEHYSDWNSGNSVHQAWTIRGIIALEKGEDAHALNCLLASARVSGSPQLNSFGPSMILAKRLLDQGYREQVTAYLHEVSLFWETEKIVSWIQGIESGTSVDFGGNLVCAFT